MAGDDLDEFDLIASLFAPLGADAPEARGLRDDAAVLSVPAGRELVVTTDTVVEGVHFPEAEDPALIARKAVRVNLSDLAGMGASPRAVLLNLGLSDHADRAWVEAFAAGLKEDLTEFDVALIGGDTVATGPRAMVTVTAFGEVPEGGALGRAGARAGDVVCVSGTIGDAAFGLKAVLGELTDEDGALMDRYRLPRPRVALGVALGQGVLNGSVSAGMDVSDGLLQDLGHICGASGLGAEVDLAAVPLSDAARRVMTNQPELLDLAVRGGDDYELLFTLSPAAVEAGLVDRLSEIGDVPVSVIGRLVVGDGVVVVDAAGQKRPAGAGGYRHRFGGA